MKVPARLLTPLLCLLLVMLTVLAAEPEVDSYEISCQLDKKGNQAWALDLTMALPADCSRLEIPLPGTVEHINITGVRHKLQTNADGQPILILTDSKGFSPMQTFHITWKSSMDLTGSQTTNPQLKLLSSYFPWQVQTLSFRITLPAAPSGDVVCESGYYGAIDTETCPFSVSGSQISGSLPAGLLAFDSFTVSLELPEGTFVVPGKLAGYLTSAVGILEILSLCVLAAALIVWFRRCRMGRLHIQTRSLPPESFTAGALPYVLWGKQPRLEALILQWAASGYLTVYYRDGAVVLRRRMAMGSERQQDEQQLFRLLFSQSELCQFPDEALLQAIRKLQAQQKKALRRRLFAPGRPMVGRLRLLSALGMALSTAALLRALLPQGGSWTAVSLLGMIPGFIWGLYLQYTAAQLSMLPAGSRKREIEVLVLSGLVGLFGLGRGSWMLLPMQLMQCFVSLQTVFGARRTSEGRESLRQALGLRRYFLTVTQEQLRTALRHDPMFFYRMLPWAQGLGLGRSFSQCFGSLTMEPADWFPGSDGTLTAARFYEMLSPVLDLLRH